MNVARMREYATRGRRIHQSLPVEPVTTMEITYRASDYTSTGVSDTRVSELCRIGPNAKHAPRCDAVWCKCPCHDDHENYGYGLAGWGD